MACTGRTLVKRSSKLFQIGTVTNRDCPTEVNEVSRIVPYFCINSLRCTLQSIVLLLDILGFFSKGYISQVGWSKVK